eukprot:5710708-Amphidinium_carterae.1
MDQQAKIAQEANSKREQFREELVTVYVCLEKLPTEPWPVPKTPAASSGDGPGAPAQTPEALLAMMAFTKSKAQEGDQEAQVIYEQMALSQEVEHMLHDARELRRRRLACPTPTSKSTSKIDQNYLKIKIELKTS